MAIPCQRSSSRHRIFWSGLQVKETSSANSPTADLIYEINRPVLTDPRPRSTAPGTVPHDAVRRSFFCCIKGANNLGAKARLWVSRRWQEVKLRIPDTGLSKLIVELHPTSSLLLFSLRMLPSGASSTIRHELSLGCVA